MNNILRVIIFLFSLSVYAQSDTLVVKNDNSTIVQKKFENKNLDQYKSDSDFNYEEHVATEPSFIERVFNWLGRQLKRLLEWIFGVKYATDIFAAILTAIPYVIAGIVLLLLLKFFLKVNSNAFVSNSKNIPAVVITEEEELINSKDISVLIEKAIRQKNYRLAVRYYYIHILKQLENHQFISWEQQKTNDDYSKEISQKSIKKSFIKLTRLYDFVWYGNFDINEMEFAKIETDFIEMNHLILKK
ncbi:MAG: DUF4129 domain-containing protein [Lutibacter sp.]|uniref:DUF4129 domain-containing protein n=1 Tax=Lutibacter sp. TaxID=1925666 RepID=UPI00181F64F7|nr:DUF4129 domain-containing protein [Lutibacter sp.]MBT8317058.1 DUF4129 domain-containing protein [Lutibacter sp.]NNJ57918.1 DUF4129 domain-containing protein [Lutibacter sp.]